MERPEVRSKRRTTEKAAVAAFRRVRPLRPSSRPCRKVAGDGVRDPPWRWPPATVVDSNRRCRHYRRRRYRHRRRHRSWPLDGNNGQRPLRRPTNSAVGPYCGASRTWVTERPTCWACVRWRRRRQWRPTTNVTNTIPNNWRTFSATWVSIPRSTSECRTIKIL